METDTKSWEEKEGRKVSKVEGQRAMHVMERKLSVSTPGELPRAALQGGLYSLEEGAWKCEGSRMHPDLGQGAVRPRGGGPCPV